MMKKPMRSTKQLVRSANNMDAMPNPKSLERVSKVTDKAQAEGSEAMGDTSEGGCCTTQVSRHPQPVTRSQMLKRVQHDGSTKTDSLRWEFCNSHEDLEPSIEHSGLSQRLNKKPGAKKLGRSLSTYYLQLFT